MRKPTLLIILDGWGLGPPGPGNALSLAKLKHVPALWEAYPHTQLAASGEAVGSSAGECGNTEIGHLNLGAGRVVYQDLPRINMAITDGSFFRNPTFVAAIENVNQHKSAIHLLGLLSDSGVHAKLEHLYALLQMVKLRSCQRPVYLHLFSDGRDSSPGAAQKFIRELETRCRSIGVGTIATIIGRYFAMDRDRRWERTEKAYQALTENVSPTAPNAAAAISLAYQNGKTDEFIEPIAICDQQNQPYPRITNYDSVIFYNFRIDRPRQLTRAFVLPNFETVIHGESFDPYMVKYFHKHVIELDTRNKPFKRRIILSNLFFVTMTEYENSLPCAVAFPPEIVKVPLTEVLSEKGLRQLRIAETEKERFVTYYFNGQREYHFPSEDRLIVPSAKISTYDLQPEMSAYEITQRLLEALGSDKYEFILVNFANPDMVGHTGNIPAATRACEVVDECVGKIIDRVLVLDGTCVVAADHGNVEEMLTAGGQVDTEHSNNPVPFIIINRALANRRLVLPQGKLADVAPTILAQMHIEIPKEMTGKNLLRNAG